MNLKNIQSYYFIKFIIVVFSSYSSYSQNKNELYDNVDHVIKEVIDRNPDLKNYLLQQEKAKLDYKNSKNFFLPNISGSASFQNNISLATTALPGEIIGQPGEIIELQIGQKYNYNVGINLSKTIFDREKKIKAKISGISSEIAEAQTKSFEQNLKEQAAFYYYSILIGDQAIKTSKDDVKTSDSIYKITSKKYEKGLIDITLKNKAKINSNRAKQNLLSNLSLKNQSENNLKNLLGLTNLDSLRFKKTDIIYNEDFNTNLVLNNDKNLVVKELQYQQANLNIKKERATFLPTLSVNSYFGKQQLSNETGISFDSGSWNNYSFATVNLNIPIFSGLSKKNNLKKAKIDNKIALQNLSTEKSKSILKDQQLITDYSNYQEILKSAKENYILMKQNADIAFVKYQQGVLSLDEYFNKYNEYLKEKNNYLNSLSTTYSLYATILSRQ